MSVEVLDPKTLHSPLVEAMGISFVSWSAQELQATMPVAGNTQPYGQLHGGASCVLAETLGSIGAALHASRTGRVAVGIEISATHHRAVSSGTVTGTARALHLGSSLATYEILIHDESGRRICTSRLTCMILPGPVPGERPRGSAER